MLKTGRQATPSTRLDDVTLDDLYEALSRQAASTFVADLVHEIRQPVVAITNYSFALNRELRSVADGADDLVKPIGWSLQLPVEADRIDQILGEADAAIRPVIADLRAHDMVAIVSHLRDLLAASPRFAGWVIATELPSEPVLAHCDPVTVMVAAMELMLRATRRCVPGERECRLELIVRGEPTSVVCSVRDFIESGDATTRGGLPNQRMPSSTEEAADVTTQPQGTADAALPSGTHRSRPASAVPVGLVNANRRRGDCESERLIAACMDAMQGRIDVQPADPGSRVLLRFLPGGITPTDSHRGADVVLRSYDGPEQLPMPKSATATEPTPARAGPERSS